MCKTKFEMMVDDVVFLGFPLHVRPDGTWRKKKKRRRGSGEDGEEDEEGVNGEEVMNGVNGDGNAEGEDAEGGSRGEENGKEDIEGGENGYDKEPNGYEEVEKHPENDPQDHDADDEKDDDEHSSTHGGGMSMFHVVFVLNPPELEYRFRTQEIFDYVVKRFARALKYEQAKDGYVWREAGKINRLREKAVQEGMFCMVVLFFNSVLIGFVKYTTPSLNYWKVGYETASANWQRHLLLRALETNS